MIESCVLSRIEHERQHVVIAFLTNNMHECISTPRVFIRSYIKRLGIVVDYENVLLIDSSKVINHLASELPHAALCYHVCNIGGLFILKDEKYLKALSEYYKSSF